MHELTPTEADRERAKRTGKPPLYFSIQRKFGKQTVM